MARTSRISDAEWQVMQIVWDRAPVAAAEVIKSLEGRSGWNHRTIRTLLNRLVNKNVLAYEVDGNRYLYRPKVVRDRCVREESRSFLKKVFGGDTASLLLHFAQNSQLSKKGAAELRRILDERENQR
jgi:BlaI family transcriptional regulator, penicillinase repressor